jgi:hypothetical protein
MALATTIVPEGAPDLADNATRSEVAEAITWHNAAVKRVPAISGLTRHPTRYDFLHMKINKLLDRYQTAAD